LPGGWFPTHRAFQAVIWRSKVLTVDFTVVPD
jgi:hypothetical protein